MKKALVLTSVLAFVVSLGALAAGPFSGYWESELTIGIEDVTITTGGQYITIPGGTYDVVNGTVTIPDQPFTLTVEGQTIPITIPGQTKWVGPWSLTLFEGDLTLDVENGVVTVPSQDVIVDLPDGDVEVTFDGFSFELPIFHDKEFDLALFVAEKTIDVDEPDAVYFYGGLVDYHYVVQSAGVTLLEGDGTISLEDLGLDDSGIVPFTVWQWEKLCWDEGSWAELWLPGVIDTSLFPEPGKHLQVDFPPFEVKVKCADLADPWILGVLGRTATGFDQNNNDVTVTLYQHDVELDVVATPEVTIPNPPNNWAYALDTFDEQHWLIVKIEPKAFDLTWPDWPRCCTSEDPRPEVCVQWVDVDTAVYQYTGEYDNPDGSEIEEMKADVEASGAGVLDKIGFGFLNTVQECYEVDTNGQIVIPQGDILGDFLIGSYIVGYETLTFGPYILTGTYEGEEVTINIPAQEGLEVVGGTITIPEVEIEVPADSIEIDPYSFDVVVDGHTHTFTVGGGTYAVVGGEVVIGNQQVWVPGASAVIEDKLTLGFTSTLSVDYTVCNWTFNSTSKFENEYGWKDQSFSAKGDLGAFVISSKVTFDPPTAAFERWDSSVSVSIAGVSFGADFVLVPGKSGFTLSASGVAGNCNLGAILNLNIDADGDPITGNCVCFTSIHFDFDFSFACIELVDVDIDFSDSGFDGITFAVKGIVIPNIPWVTFDAKVTFDDGVTGKVVSVTPSLSFGAFDCITLYGALIGTFPDITGFSVYGAKLAYTWNGVTFTDVTVFDYPAYSVTSGLGIVAAGKTGSTTYWEAFQLKFDSDACCGGLFDFSITTFFEKDSAILFDWGKSVAAFSMGIGSNYTVSTSLTIDDTGLEQWKIGFKVTF